MTAKTLIGNARPAAVGTVPQPSRPTPIGHTDKERQR